MMRHFLHYIVIITVGVSLQQPTNAFINGRGLSPSPYQKCLKGSSALGSGDIFDSFRKLLAGDDDRDEDSDIDDDLPAGTTLLASIPGVFAIIESIIMKVLKALNFALLYSCSNIHQTRRSEIVPDVLLYGNAKYSRSEHLES
jgi:hypothetical protein